MVFSPFADLSDTIHLGTMSFPATAAHTLLFTWLKKKKKKSSSLQETPAKSILLNTGKDAAFLQSVSFSK